MSPDDYCQQRAARSGSSFYYSFRFLPDERRQAITALYAFCREVDDAVDECTDVVIARQKLDWWRAEVDRLFAHTPTHPVTCALLVSLTRFRLAQGHFHEIINGMQMDLDYDAYPTFNELSQYCYRVASVVGLLSAEIFGFQNSQTLRYAQDLGMAFQLTNILRDVHEDAMRGRVYIPLDELAKFGVKPEALRETRTSPAAAELFKFQAQRAREYYQRAFKHLPIEDRHTQRSGIIMAEIYLATLQEIEVDQYRVLEHRISLTPLRKLWIAWTTARREKKQRRLNPVAA
ncbi:MAG: presqualene diphosphate synthase HpnD [Gammaproteobacteria bacterium]|nr:presqualene diphosphate synthase HpnD [Gammaproteobacteria bacterium]